MGFNVSNVLLILSIDNAVFKLAILETPVPPDVTGIVPIILSASTLFANCAYATY